MPYEGKYAKEINRASNKYKIDPLLISAVIEVESGWNPNAVSHVGAQGLMQLMPIHGLKNPFDPEENIMAGARFLSGLIKEFKRVDLALAGYNAGASAVRKYNGIPPYDETRNYVSKVLSIYSGHGMIEPSGFDIGGIFSKLSSLISSPIFLLGVLAIFLFKK